MTAIQTIQQNTSRLNAPAAAETVEQPHDRGAAFWADASLLGVAIIWGVNIPIMKNGLDRIDDFVFNAVRLTVSALVLAVFAWRERRLRPEYVGRLPWGQLILYSLLVSAVYQLCFLMGVSRTTSGNTALIIATVPLWTALLARIFIGERLHRLAWLGLAVALSGTIIVALQKGDVDVGGKRLWGNLIVLASAITWAASAVYGRPLLKHTSPMQLSAAASLIALPVHIVFAAPSYASSLPALKDVELWLIILYSGVLSSGLALPMWNYGLRHAGASHASIIQNLVPLFAIATAWLMRGEPVTSAQVIGGALILGGLIAMRVTRKPAVPL
jgi:drug/metabolite transporter (DMT)-like permease